MRFLNILKLMGSLFTRVDQTKRSLSWDHLLSAPARTPTALFKEASHHVGVGEVIKH